MNEPYPLPSYVTQIWLVGDQIHLALPADPGGKCHTIVLPLAKCAIECADGGAPLSTQRGWLVLLDILKSRQQERQSPHSIGTRSSPVQYDIDALLRATAPARKFDERGAEQLDYETLFGAKVSP